ncbi:MAG: methyl-accepting chemotaxis protein [Methylococcales bacterium]
MEINNTIWMVLVAIIFWSLGWRMCERRLASTDPSARKKNVAVDVDLATKVDVYAKSLQDFSQQVPPVWSALIDSSRLQMENAINALTLRFNNIVNNLDSVLELTQSVLIESDQNVFESSRNRLNQVAINLDQGLNDKRLMLETIKTLVNFIGDMQGMATDVTQFAEQTKQLAEHAWIEAGLAGDAGQGFSVVAEKIKQLASASGNTGKQFCDKVNEINAAITNAFLIAEAASKANAESVTSANVQIQDVLTDMQAVLDFLKLANQRLGDKAQGIKEEVFESIVQFQFQDRIGQTLTHVRDSIGQLPQHIAQSLATGEHSLKPLDISAMQNQLEHSYTMAEEHQLHNGRKQAVPNPVEITFF